MQYSQAISSVGIDLHGDITQETNDAELVTAISGGDRQAMQVLWARYNVRLFRFLLRFVSDEATAEDLVSEVFFDVWRQATRFEGRSQVSTWLMAIARNKALSALRRKAGEELDEEVAEFIEDPSDTPEVSMQNRQRSEILQSCLKQLSAAHREIIDLVYYHEKSIEEVSEIIGVPQNTVKTRMFYARKRLGELMEAQGLTLASV